MFQVLLGVTLVILAGVIQAFPNPILSYKKCGRVHITVSSLKETYLELNWITKCDKARDVKPDFIAMYDYNPKERHEERPHLVMIRADFYPGFYKTKIKFREPWLPGNWEYQENVTNADSGEHCFPYWIAALKANNEIIDSACLSIRPTWMSDIRDQLKSQRIGNIFIPGTHNSASFDGVPKFLHDIILNQDRSVWTQLVFGIRYLDLRVGYYHNEGFFINHDIVRLAKLQPVLHEIRRFAEMAPKEVIIVDFHRFPYPTQFTINMHMDLVELIKSELGHLALPPGGLQAGKGPTFNEIWHQNKTLIICYGKREIAKEYNWLWNPLQQHWGNKQTVGELKSFVASTIKDHATIFNPMWALMAELTPQPLDVIFMLRSNSLRALADSVNMHLTSWFRDDWSKDVNIVATDFFLGNDLINVAIETNKHR